MASKKEPLDPFIGSEYPLAIGSKKQGFSLSLTPSNKSLDSILQVFSKELDEEKITKIGLAIEKWVRKFNSTLPNTVQQVLYPKTGMRGISGSKLHLDRGFDETKAGKGFVYEYNLSMKFGPVAKYYGGVQEYGRPVGTGKRRSKYYMVPVRSEFPATTNMTPAIIKSKLSEDGVFWAPRGVGNFGVDRSGLKVKYVFQYTGKGKGYNRNKPNSAGGINNEGKRNAMAAAEKSVRAGRQRTSSKVVAKARMASMAKLIFLAYPWSSGVPGIPGGSKGKYSRVGHNRPLPVFSDPLVQQVTSRKMRGRGEASRWFSVNLIHNAKHLDTYLKQAFS